jgi:chitin disaccharide deacetylase
VSVHAAVARGVPRGRRGLLIVNADDWGRDPETTRAIVDGIHCGAVSAVSAMVFMADSERASNIARDDGVDAGLHLNFTTPWSAPGCPGRLVEQQAILARYLTRYRLAPVVFQPRLAGPFEYVVSAQIAEFRRLYGTDPVRFDGHHHMHLCANLLIQRLLPAGSLVRRNFSFTPGERGHLNRIYRRLVDRWLARRYRLVDFFFSLPPLTTSNRLSRILALARGHVVEVETHPVSPDEHHFLVGGEFLERTADIRIAPPPAVTNRLRP